MEYLEFTEHPSLRAPTMLMAFAGWPDAAEGATGALKYLVRKLSAKRFASIDPEEFYSFTRVRPITRTNEEGQRELTWPANDFYYWDSGEQEQDLLIFIGVEPNLKWRAYSHLIFDVAREQGVKRVVVLGALLDGVPHTREIRITGRATDPAIQEALGDRGVRGSGYQGPTGISTAVLQHFQDQNMPYGSIWAHSPHYLQVSYYPKVSLSLLTKLGGLLSMKFDLEELVATQETFDRQFQGALESEADLQRYIHRLERRYDEWAEQEGPMPTPEEMVQEMERFLKQRQSSNGSDDQPTS